MNLRFALITATSILVGMSTSPAIAQRLYKQPDFFEWGNRQIEQEIKRLQQGSDSNLLTVQDSQEQQWQPIVLADAGLSVWMPAGVLSQEDEAIILAGTEVNFRLLASYQPASRFVVAYSEPLSQSLLSDRDQLFAQMQARIVDRTEFSVTESYAKNCGALPGQEVILQKADEVITIKLCLAPTRVYVMGVRREPEALSPNALNAFFSSFKLVN
jgi:hypothetical protein